MAAAAGASSVTRDNHTRTHAGDVLSGGHRNTVVPIGRDCVRGGHVVPARRYRVYDLLLLLGLDIYRDGLRVPVLGVLCLVRSVHVSAVAGSDRDCSGSLVLDRSHAIKEQDHRIR